MTRSLRIRSKSGASAAALLLLAGGSSVACAQVLGVEDNPELDTSATTTTTGTGKCKGALRVRVTTDDSGTAQDIAKPYTQAIHDYLRELDAQGGLRGCSVDVDVQDGNYTVEATQAAVTAWSKKAEWNEVSALFIFGTGPTKTVSQMPEVEGKIIIPGSYAGAFTSPKAVDKMVTYPEVNSEGQTFMTKAAKTSPGYPYIFFPATDYSTGIRIGIQAAWKIQPGKMAMVYDNSCAYCTDPLVAGKSYILNLPGMELTEDIDTIPQTSDTTKIADIAATIKALVDADIAKVQADPGYHPVKWLWCGNSVTSCAAVAKGAGQGNMDVLAQIAEPNQQWTVRVIANNWGIGETSSSLCATGGTDFDCDDVLFGLFPVPRYGDTTVASGMQAMMSLHGAWAMKDGHDTKLYQDVRYVQGYAAALMWRKGMEAAIDAGHESPTGEDLKAELEKFNQIVIEGMTAGPISFSGADHRPQGNEWIYKLHQGELTYVDQVSLSLDPNWLGF